MSSFKPELEDFIVQKYPTLISYAWVEIKMISTKSDDKSRNKEGK